MRPGLALRSSILPLIRADSHRSRSQETKDESFRIHSSASLLRLPVVRLFIIIPVRTQSTLDSTQVLYIQANSRRIDPNGKYGFTKILRTLINSRTCNLSDFAAGSFRTRGEPSAVGGPDGELPIQLEL